jgi:hypothetical protein
MRRAAKNDGNQKEIVEQLRKLGCSVQTGHDDILVGWQGRTFWLEIKNPDGRNRKQESQKKLEREWQGHYRVVSSLDEILAELDLVKQGDP